jgi:protein-disulfide isomerase
MEKRIFTLIFVVIIGVLVGVGIVSKEGRESLLHDVLEQQNAMLAAQKRFEKSLTSGEAVNQSSGISALLQKQIAMEGRIVALEEKFTGLQDAIKQAVNGGDARQGPPPEDLSTVYDIPVDGSALRGNPNAPVTIVAFDDYQCPFCSRFHPPILEVLKAYPDKVNFMIKNFPLSFHPQAKPAAKAVLAAGEQGKYFEMADILLANNSDLSEERFKQEAEKLGLNVKAFLADYKNKDGQWENSIQKDIDLASQVNVRGTPTFYINGKKTNARDFNSFKREIDQILNN